MPIEGHYPLYQVYLLRVWAESAASSSARQPWRYSLEDPHTGKRRGFTSLEEMCAFIQQVQAGDAELPIDDS